jgi:methylphosphotriester-DNA--protein-cysteine methyltransferase
MNQPTPSTCADSSAEVNQALVDLCAAVLPVWGRQLVTSRSQSEAAVSEMLSAFAEIGPHLDMAARQSHQVSAALAQGEDGITLLAQACADELAPVLQRLDPLAAQAVQRVIAMIHKSVDALEQIAKPFVHETEMVSRQVERMYIGFQYQDRISQMMSLLHEDIERLQTVLQQPGMEPAALAQQDWLDRLESQYAMTEQRHSHSAHATPMGAPPVSVDDDSIFF